MAARNASRRSSSATIALMSASACAVACGLMRTDQRMCRAMRLRTVRHRLHAVLRRRPIEELRRRPRRRPRDGLATAVGHCDEPLRPVPTRNRATSRLRDASAAPGAVQRRQVDPAARRRDAPRRAPPARTHDCADARRHSADAVRVLARLRVWTRLRGSAPAPWLRSFPRSRRNETSCGAWRRLEMPARFLGWPPRRCAGWRCRGADAGGRTPLEPCSPRVGFDQRDRRADRRPSRLHSPGSLRACPRPAPAHRCRPCRSRVRTAARRARRDRPTALSQRTIVPSDSDSPIWGMTTCATRASRIGSLRLSDATAQYSNTSTAAR